MLDNLRRNEYVGFFVILGLSVLASLYFYYPVVNVSFLYWILPHNTGLWEFGRVMFTAILLYSIIQYFILGREFPNFIFAKVAVIFIAPIIFIAGTYSINILIGEAYAATHIIMYVVSLALGQVIGYQFIKNEFYFKLMNGYAVLGTIVMLLVFASYLNQTEQFRSPIFKPMEQFRESFMFRS